MNQTEVFSNARWVCAGHYAAPNALQPDADGTPHFPILRRTFRADGVRKAVLRVVGLGFFHCYLNGKEITEDAFLPLSTDYEPRNQYPTDEKVTGHRLYVPEYEVTSLLHPGENVLALHFGGGWYTFEDARFGDPKAIYRLTLETAEGLTALVSSEADKIGDSYVKTYSMPKFERQDFTAFDDEVFSESFDDSGWKHALPAVPPDTDYQFSDCPADRVEEKRAVTCLLAGETEKCYDTGRNCSSLPVLKLRAPKGETVTVLFAEERCADGSPDMNFHYGQEFSVVSDGTERVVQPMFTWFAYRYFKVIGRADVLGVKVIHSDVKVSSSFDSDNETLNWIYRAFLNTQLSNMHAGIPSDCPHIERRGYTGDGQLICHTAMDVLDARSFYRKWIADIGDCQDIYTGHMQYTAPYTYCGGGPGGWGCAIVEVPYQYYKHYGDTEPLFRLYPQMLRYFDYLEAHSENDIVSSDKKGAWCLGDWCAPERVVLPAGFVNNYFYIKSLRRAMEIAKIVGREVDLPALEQKIARRRKAVTAAYFNTWDGNFIGSLQGANAFAVDMGVGDERTYPNLVQYYRHLGHFDTGIFGTDIVTRVLFEHGDGELAMQLITSQNPVSFEGMRQAGATTLWENWPHARWDRSRNHPMFGAVTAYLFDELLGIRQKPETAGYSELVIAPAVAGNWTRLSGSRTLPAGEVRVSCVRAENRVSFCITLPENLPAVFSLNGQTLPLHAGTNQIAAVLTE